MSKTHNLSKSKLYYVWYNMKNRCYKTTNREYKRYGARGVIICDEWKDDIVAFYNWATNNGYKDGLTIDRINVDGNYEPNNCRFITPYEQSINRRDNFYIEKDGVRKTMSEWTKETGTHHQTIRYRLNRGWDISELFESSYVRGRGNFRHIKTQNGGE